MLTLPKLIISIGSLFIAIPSAVVFFKYRRLNTAIKAIAYYVLLGGVIQLISSYISAQKHNNLWLLHVYTPLEFASILYFYSFILGGFIGKKTFLWSGIIFAILSVLNTEFLQNTLTFNTYARSIQGILVIFLCLLWCYKTLTEMKIKDLEQDPVFWINTGFLLYFSGSILLFAFSNYILGKNGALNMYIWAFHALFSILLYALITIGLWKAK